MSQSVTVVGLIAVALMISACGQGAVPQSGSSSTPADATPATVASSPTTPAWATPNASGDYLGVTLAQAKQLVPYHLAQPQWVPTYLVSQGFAATGRPPGEKGSFPFVTLYYVPADRSQHDSVQIVEHGGTLHTTFPADATSSTLTIVGHTVSREAWTTSAGHLAIFTWQDQGTTFQLQAGTNAPLTEVDVEHMIASMLRQGG